MACLLPFKFLRKKESSFHPPLLPQEGGVTGFAYPQQQTMSLCFGAERELPELSSCFRKLGFSQGTLGLGIMK